MITKNLFLNLLGTIQVKCLLTVAAREKTDARRAKTHLYKSRPAWPTTSYSRAQLTKEEKEKEERKAVPNEWNQGIEDELLSFQSFSIHLSTLDWTREKEKIHESPIQDIPRKPFDS